MLFILIGIFNACYYLWDIEGRNIIFWDLEHYDVDITPEPALMRCFVYCLERATERYAFVSYFIFFPSPASPSLKQFFYYFSFCFVLYCFVFCCFVLYCFVLSCLVLSCLVLFCFVLFCSVLFRHEAQTKGIILLVNLSNWSMARFSMRIVNSFFGTVRVLPTFHKFIFYQILYQFLPFL
jgi:hypothetical protein